VKNVPYFSYSSSKSFIYSICLWAPTLYGSNINWNMHSGSLILGTCIFQFNQFYLLFVMLEIFFVYFGVWIDSFNVIIIIVVYLFIMYIYLLIWLRYSVTKIKISSSNYKYSKLVKLVHQITLIFFDNLKLYVKLYK